ncbi:unnamed protein product [Toxocara canis]|uniref:G_PROTEIN_RECEP_F1_2 domain-containing protein n=1 Tax=Toxocara canis TaxID=6265 RepID=A0A183UA76_TOXCA|nr:unnamed protein product [Toxocara canis]
MISVILTITFLLFSYNEVMPRVSYIKAMDVYLVATLFSDTSIVAGLLPTIQMRASKICHGHAGLSDSSPPAVFESNEAQKVKTNYTAVHMGRLSSVSLNSSMEKTLPQGVTVANQNREALTLDSCTRYARHLLAHETKHMYTVCALFFRLTMCFFFGFVTFCLFYFLVYPNIHTAAIDPACIRESAEWFAIFS